jgi:hypothetical protein
MQIGAMLRRLLAPVLLAGLTAATGATAAPGGSPTPAPATATVTQQADGLLVENATFQLGEVSYRVPRAELRGTTLSAAEVSALLDPASPEPVAARIARLSASEIVAPRITAEQRLGNNGQTTIYRDVALSGLGDGRIRSGRAGSATFEVVGETGSSRGGFTHFALTDFDLASSIALFTDKAPAGSVPVKKLYGSFALEGVNLVDPAGTTTRIARIGGRDLSARPTAEGWTGTMNILGASPPNLSDAEPEQRRRIFTALADMLGAFEIGALEASGIEVQDPKNPDGAARIARIGFVGSAEGGGEFQLDGLDAGSADGRVRIGSIAIGGIALKPMLDGLREVAAGSGDFGPAEMRRFVPATGTMRLAGLVVDPAKQAKGAGSPEPIIVGGIEIAAGKPVEGLPSEMRIVLSDLSLGVAGADEDSPLGQLSGLGYDKLSLSFGAAANWNEARQEIVIQDVSVRAPAMGSATLAGTIGHVPRDVFHADSTIAAVALVGITAQSLDLTVQNDGLFERIVAREAKRQQRSPEELRRDYGIAAAIGVPAALGNSAAAKTLGNAIARFVAKPGRLAIQAKVKDGTGVGLADLAAGAEPAAMLDRLEVTAKAE